MTPAEKRNYVVRVRSKLCRRPRTLPLKRISDDTGLSTGWLKSFSRGQYERPSMSMVMALESYLYEAEVDA